MKNQRTNENALSLSRGSLSGKEKIFGTTTSSPDSSPSSFIINIVNGVAWMKPNSYEEMHSQ